MALEVDGGAPEASTGSQGTGLDFNLPLLRLSLVTDSRDEHQLTKTSTWSFLQYKLVYFSVVLFVCCPRHYVLAIQSL